MSEDKRRTLTARLNTVLATTVDLASQVKQAHWNIKGPQFFARHQLFDHLADHLRAASDSVAERAATLGATAFGTARQAAANSILPEYELSAVDGRQHIQELATRYGKLGELLRTAIDESEKVGDPVTVDLYTEILRQAELDTWFLESHMMS
jgi:starvation-inducible DNA-binding protein